MKQIHIPVLLQTSLDLLGIKPNDTVVDATLGGAGHSKAFLKQLEGKGNLIAFDLDKNALENFRQQLQPEGFELVETKERSVVLKRDKQQIFLVHDNFAQLEEYLSVFSIKNVDVIFADLGFSSMQLTTNTGLSFLQDSDLDMRFDERLSVTAKDLINGLYRKELLKMFRELADIDFAEKLVTEIISEREKVPINNTKQLRLLVQKVVPQQLRKGTKKYPEAKVFQALRIAVNNELGSLRSFLPQAFSALSSQGKLGVISFHSGEDRIVKNFFRELNSLQKATYIKKLITPAPEEISENPRSRSAKLRVIQKQ